MATREQYPVETLLGSWHVSPGEENSVLSRADNFCKAKDKEGAAGKRWSRYDSNQGDKYATPNSTRGRIDADPLCADHRLLFMLRWTARASNVLCKLSAIGIWAVGHPKWGVHEMLGG